MFREFLELERDREISLKEVIHRSLNPRLPMAVFGHLWWYIGQSEWSNGGWVDRSEVRLILSMRMNQGTVFWFGQVGETKRCVLNFPNFRSL